MKRTDVVVIGAGHSGLAMSHQLAQHSVDHVVLEKGRIANSWHTERWDSLNLLTPNWANGAPGQPYEGASPDGFMGVKEYARTLERCATLNAAPVMTNTDVISVEENCGGFLVQTTGGAIRCNGVAIATGACAKPKLPEFADEVPGAVTSLSPLEYKRPSDLPDGPVLVVGASASGQQLAREIQLSGRQVTLSVSSHVRMPRRYRGADIMTWIDRVGLFDIPWTDVDDIDRVRRTPSVALQGEDETVGLDLNQLQKLGVEIVGRLGAIRDNTALFSGGLANVCAAADLKMYRLLSTIDAWIDDHPELSTPDVDALPVETTLPDRPQMTAKLGQGGIQSVIWATGFQPDHSSLNLPVFDRKGRIQHQGGVVMPGISVMGLSYLRTRRSTFISGAEADARALLPNLLLPTLGKLVA